jgi:hypothetical protein
MRNPIKKLLLATVMTAAIVTAPLAFAADQFVPVMVPFWDDILDPDNPGNACGSSGTIKVDTFVSVRAGPGIRYREIDRVLNGQKLVICDGQHDGWFPVVYVRGEEAYADKRCWRREMADRHLPPHPYLGPCRSGWVNKNYVNDLAG